MGTAKNPGRQDAGAGRVKLMFTPETKRALKTRAAGLGLTLAAYVVRLAREDGVDVETASARAPSETIMWESAAHSWKLVSGAC